jgi:hypothetical protein
VAVTGPPPLNESAITILLAEYVALRAEIVSRLSSQATLVGVTLTAEGVVAGIVLTGKTSPDLLLVVPIIAPALGLFYIDHMRQLGLVGLYIRSTLWPLLQGQVANVAIPSWEATWAAYNDPERHTRKRAYINFLLLMALPPGAVFFLSAVVALAITASAAFRDAAYAALWALGCSLTVLFASSAVFLAAVYRARELETMIAPSEPITGDVGPTRAPVPETTDTATGSGRRPGAAAADPVAEPDG